eukprot:GHRQ01019725.1.p1 GENE.GHRQ01019725.1~~GHRQ01019725.1.p1  ORF type:complete len:133 (+),score=50.27 GHRQ01019725.1:264-662(+)
MCTSRPRIAVVLRCFTRPCLTLARLLHLLAGTSLENNNVFTVQPTVYFEGMDPATESASMYQDVDLMPSGPLNPATVTVGIVALGIVAVAGSATAIYYESVIGLAAFWVVLGGLVGVAGFNYVNSKQIKDQP